MEAGTLLIIIQDTIPGDIHTTITGTDTTEDIMVTDTTEVVIMVADITTIITT